MPQENVGLASFATKVTYWFSQFSATFFKYLNYFWYFNLFWNRCSTKFNKRLTFIGIVKVQSTIYLI
jgi:hypothetical protein